MAIVVLTNTTDAPITQISTGIINLFNIIQNRWDQFYEPSGDLPDYHDFEGLVWSPYGIYLIAQIGRKLTIFDMDSKDPASNFIILESQGENKFVSAVPLFFAKENEPIEFKPDETGRIFLYGSMGRKVNWFIYDTYCRL